MHGLVALLSGLRLAGQLTGLAGFIVFVTGFVIGIIQPTPDCAPPRGMLCEAEGVERALVMTVALWSVGLAMVLAAVGMLFVVTRRGDRAMAEAAEASAAAPGPAAQGPAVPGSAGQGAAPGPAGPGPAAPAQRIASGPARAPPEDARSEMPRAPAARPVHAAAGGLRKRERAPKGRRR